MECISIYEKIKFIENSTSLEQVQKSGILPDPDAQKGYYFISYSHKDYKIVFRHVLRLLEQGVNLWYDRGLEAGKSWRDDVKKKIFIDIIPTSFDDRIEYRCVHSNRHHRLTEPIYHIIFL